MTPTPDPATVRAACERIRDLSGDVADVLQGGAHWDNLTYRGSLLHDLLDAALIVRRAYLAAHDPPADARPAAGTMIARLHTLADVEDRVGSVYPTPGFIRDVALTMTLDHRRVAELEAERDQLRGACKAAVKYDESIAGKAARGEVDLGECSYATGDDLDDLYTDWIGKARQALAEGRP